MLRAHPGFLHWPHHAPKSEVSPGLGNKIGHDGSHKGIILVSVTAITAITLTPVALLMFDGSRTASIQAEYLRLQREASEASCVKPGPACQPGGGAKAQPRPPLRYKVDVR